MDHIEFLEKLQTLGLLELEEPATKQEIEEAQDSLHFALPADVAAFFRRTNGLNAFGGNLRVNPILSDDEFNLRDASDSYRDSKWPIPLEMVVFNDDGAGCPYGLWQNEKDSTSCAVVQMGEIFEGKSMTVCALTFAVFIRIQLSFQLLLDDRGNFDLARNYVPIGENAKVVSDDELLQIVTLSVNSGLSMLQFDPYQDKLAKGDIKKILATLK